MCASLSTKTSGSGKRVEIEEQTAWTEEDEAVKEVLSLAVAAISQEPRRLEIPVPAPHYSLSADCFAFLSFSYVASFSPRRQDERETNSQNNQLFSSQELREAGLTRPEQLTRRRETDKPSREKQSLYRDSQGQK